jgi:RimJ/RimL family protein N-acetyltransferase
MRLKGRRIMLRPQLKSEDAFIRELISELPASHKDSNAWDQHVVERKSDGSPVGIVEHRVEDPADGWATFGTIVMSDGQRGWGYGSEAVHLIEERLLKREGVRRFGARIDKRIGLALYFWLRRGYRPARPDEAFWPNQKSDDIISMIRIPEE